MKRILISVSALALVIALAGAATFASFTDTEQSNDNAVNAGTLNLLLGTDTVTPVDNGNTALYTFSNVQPGDKGVLTFKIKNGGSIAGRGTKSIQTTNFEDGCNAPELADGDTTCVARSDKGELGSAIILTSVTYNGIPESISTPPTLDEYANWFPATFDLAAGGEGTFVFHWELPYSTNNKIQGDSVGINFSANLDQLPLP